MNSNDILELAKNAFDFIEKEILTQSVVEKCMNAQQYMPMFINIAKDHMLVKGGPALKAMEPLQRLEQDNKGLADFAKSEISLGFPTLLSHSSVAMWSAVEAFVEDFLIGFVQTTPNCADLIRERYSDFKVKSGEPARRIINRWEPCLKEKYVADRYIEMITFFISSFDFDHKRANILSELSEMRNSIMHRMGVVDERFLEKVPNTNYRNGEKIVITRNDYMQIHDACANFILRFMGPDILGRI